MTRLVGWRSLTWVGMGGVRLVGGALIIALLVCGCASSPSSPVAEDSSTIPDCAVSVPVRDLAVFAIAVSTSGRVCWETALSQPVGTHSSSGPLLSGGSAYLDSDGSVFAVRLNNGLVAWRWNSGSPPSNGGDAGGNQMLAVSSGVVVATKGQVSSWVLAGLDERTGGIRWQRPEPNQLGTGPYDSGDGKIAFTAYTGSVIEVVNDANGALLWHRPEPALPSGHGLVAVANLFSSVAGNLITDNPVGGVEAVSSLTGQVRWRYPKPVNDATVVDGLLLLEPHPGTPPAYDVATVAVNPTTGQVLWSYPPVDPGGSIFFDAGGALIHTEIGPSTGQLSRVNPQTGHNTWTVSTEAYTVAAAGPVIADVESTGNQQGTESVVGRNPTTGAVQWRSTINVAPVIHAQLLAIDGPSGQVLVLQSGQQLDAYNPGTGKLGWQLDLPADTTVDGYAVASGGLLVQASRSQYQLQGH